MPQFSRHTPKTQSDMTSARSVARMDRKYLPIGVIGSGGGFSWGYDGENYYVSEGILEHLVTRISLSIDEAKQLFNALVFSSSYEPSQKLIASMVRVSRKLNASADQLMWFFVDRLED